MKKWNQVLIPTMYKRDVDVDMTKNMISLITKAAAIKKNIFIIIALVAKNIISLIIIAAVTKNITSLIIIAA
ncbi:hypothetical protein, partial [Bacillus massilioanorexius]|uniref:hypothetical protein n=1 Tax=Bacillus massilioanorexius TaxID=1468413 RepID=UPI0016525C0E